jgi:hypothetical protein
MAVQSQQSTEGRFVNLQAEHATAITPGATTYPASTLYVGTGGNITVTTAGGEAGVVFANINSGSILPVLIVAVTAATASNLVLLR